MVLEKVKELAKAVKSDPKAQETLQGLIKSADKDGIISFYADAAKRLGIDVTAENIRETIAKEGRNQKDRTEKHPPMFRHLQTMKQKTLPGEAPV